MFLFEYAQLATSLPASCISHSTAWVTGVQHHVCHRKHFVLNMVDKPTDAHKSLVSCPGPCNQKTL